MSVDIANVKMSMNPSWIVGLAAPALLYFFAARAKKADVPERMILPHEAGNADRGGQ